MVKISAIIPDSPAERLGLQTGDELLSLNGQVVRDVIDYRFYQAEAVVKVRIRRGRHYYNYRISKAIDADLGLELAPFKVKTCGNNCVFCFIKQNPRGLRRSLYLCDEDYRYSFLHGSYITLTNISQAELRRIVAQRLSPLYISVHAADPAVRKRIFRFKGDDALFEKLAYLNRHRIEMHTQIVLMPGINDGAVLEDTLARLYPLRQSILSVAIVPVGLTAHRQRLTHLEPVDAVLARHLVSNQRRWNISYRNRYDAPFVYLADEIYLVAGGRLPGYRHYGSFYQVENGVGLVRAFLDDFRRNLRRLPTRLNRRRTISFVTGTLAALLLQKYVLPRLVEIENLKIRIVPVINHFFGPSVTVAGLLSGRDIIAQIGDKWAADLLVLPPRVVNSDGMLIDNLTPTDIASASGAPVKVWDGSWQNLLRD